MAKEGLFDLVILENGGSLEDAAKTEPETKPEDSKATTVTESGEAQPAPGSTDPKAKPVDNSNDVSIPVPDKKEIDVDAYNSVIAALKKTFSEGAEIIDMLGSLKPVAKPAKDIDTLQAEFTESVIDNAEYESLVNGPYFESADNARKNDIKKAISEMRKVAPKAKDDDYSLRMFNSMGKDVAYVAGNSALNSAVLSVILAVIFKLPFETAASIGARTVVTSAVTGAAAGATMNIVQKATVRRFIENKTFKTKLWQMAGCFDAKDDEIDKAIAHYKDIFKDQLGDLTLNVMKLSIEKTKQVGSCYVLIVDDKPEKEVSVTVEPVIEKSDAEDKK